jgi:hypothetical protein
VDIVKIRVDDNLGASEHAAAGTQAVIDEAHKNGCGGLYYPRMRRVAEGGRHFIAHSIAIRTGTRRIAMLKRRDVRVSHADARVSTYVRSAAGVFDDPFFTRKRTPTSCANSRAAPAGTRRTAGPRSTKWRSRSRRAT